MNIMLAGFFGGWEIVLILAVVLILFGSKKGLGQGIKEFKKATREVTEEIHSSMDETPLPPQKKLPPTNIVTETEHTVPQAPPGQKA
jgi:sec-independent protein translocase protein TatA